MPSPQPTASQRSNWVSAKCKKLSDRRAKIAVSISGLQVKFLLDTGASRSLIQSEVFLKFQKGFYRQVTNVRLETLTGEEIETDGQIDLGLDTLGMQTFIVVSNMENEGILGNDFCEKFGVKIDFEDRIVTIRGKKFPMTLCEPGFYPKVSKVEEITEVPSWLMGVDKHNVFREELGHCVVSDPLEIETEGQPIKSRPYRQALTKRKVIEDEIDNMLKIGVIRPSTSPWASPITLVPKKDGSIRFCIDYRKLNSITIKDSYPLPNIQDIFDMLQGAQVFSTLDLRSGYWQAEMAEKDIPKTAFVTHRGLYEFSKLPFGLTNAPSQFQRLMNKILAEHIGTICFCYLDDIIIFSKTEEEHKKHLETILTTIENAGLTLKLKKCHFGQTQVELLGYVVSNKGISAQQSKVEAIRNLPEPQNVKEVRSLLGMAGYYRQLILGFAEIAEPLVTLTRKGEIFRFGDIERDSFQKLKDALCSERVMAYPDPEKPYKLYTDASQFAIGGILVQNDENGVERPIQYISKQLSSGQRKWSTIEREAFAIIHALKKLQPYLQGAMFTVFTDHKPLKSLFQCEMKNTRVQRWAMLISEFGCKIEYRKGKNMIRADMLSRIKIESIQEIMVETNLGTEQQQEFPDEWEEAETGESENYVIDEGELYSIRQPYVGAIPHPRILLPSSQRSKVVKEAHEEIGHRSFLPTMRRIQVFCIWPGMNKDTKIAIEHCVHCQGNKRNNRKTRFEITDTPTKPFQKIGMDLIGPFHPSPQGNRYLLTVIDHLTGWAEAFPIPTKTSENVWNKLYREFFPRYGIPSEVVSDQGSEFNSHEIRSNFRALQIKHKRTTPGHPQTNGITERFNRTLKETLRKLVNNDISAWEDRLAEAMLAYRISENRGRGSSPYYCVFGQEPNVDTKFYVEDNRFENLARALRYAHKRQIKNKEYRQAHGPQEDKRVDVGDYITVDISEPVTMTHIRDQACRVVSVRGKVIGYQKIQPDTNGRPSPVKFINIDRVRTVPSDLSWQDLNPRVNRYRGPSDARTLDFTHQEYESLPTESPTAIHLRLRRKRPHPRECQAQAKRLRIEVLKEVQSYFKDDK